MTWLLESVEIAEPSLRDMVLPSGLAVPGVPGALIDW